MNRQSRYVLLVILAALLFGGGVQYGRLLARSNPPLLVTESTVGPQEGEVRGEITVHVAGAVQNPGVFQLPATSRVFEAVGKAMPLPGADLNALNLAAALKDGQKITVPETGKEPVAGTAGPTGRAPSTSGSKGGDIKPPSGAGKINLNSATLQELDTLPGIGPTLARRILDYREQHGPFRVLEDILNVSGIGQSRLEQLRPLVTAE